MKWRVERLEKKEINKRTKGSLHEPITARTPHNTEVVQHGT